MTTGAYIILAVVCVVGGVLSLFDKRNSPYE